MSEEKKRTDARNGQNGQNHEDVTGTEQQESYSFLEETIKPKTISRQKLLQQFVRVAVYGVILGAFACMGFYALKPKAQNWFKGDPQTVTIPEDEKPEEDTEAADTSEDTEAQENPVLDQADYEEMLDSLYDTAQTAGKSVVAVSKVSDQEDWDAEATGIVPAVSGVITADNGQELLIFASQSVCEDAEEWAVTFSDGSEHPAALKKRDANSGFAVFGVAKKEISDVAWKSVKVATLGNSNLMKQGESVIALGNTSGYNAGVSYGIISSNSYSEEFRDGECDVLATDIPCAADGTGVLFNLKGEVVGMISSSIWEEKESNTANAYAISDLKSIIERMANGESVPYVGIYGTTVTGELQDEGIPAGIYVIDVDPDSPAMEAGIQSGDIICEVNGEVVNNIGNYQKAVLRTKAGDQIKLKGKRQGADDYVSVKFNVTVGTKE